MKDAYYFPHDSNAKDDPKCVLLIEQLGCEGYGIYWILIEILRDQPGYRYPVALLPALARRYNTSVEKVNTVVSKYELFTVEDNSVFLSESLIRRMIPLEEKRRKKSEAGKKGNLTRWKLNEDSNLSQCDRNAITQRSQVKESKVNEIKEDKNKTKASAFVPPSVGDVQAYCAERNSRIDPERFVDFYTSKGWIVGKNKMKDWKASVRTWERTDNDNRIKSKQHEQTEEKTQRYRQL
jgi:hypothetical protein